MTASEADAMCYAQFQPLRDDRQMSLPVGTTNTRWLKPDDVFQEGDMAWQEDQQYYTVVGGWRSMGATWLRRTVGRRWLNRTPFGNSQRTTMQTHGEPDDYRANETYDEKRAFERYDYDRERIRSQLMPDFRWLVGGETWIAGDRIQQSDQSWLVIDKSHWGCGRPVAKELLRWFPQGCIFREKYEKTDAVYTVYTEPVVLPRAGYTAIPAWDPSNFYGSYTGQSPNGRSVNTYPNGLRPPSKPVVARPPLTPPGERVKRVFNFDD